MGDSRECVDIENVKSVKDGKNNQYKTVAIFFGGCSTEYEVSLQSASAVIQNIDKDRYNLILIGIDRNTGKWYWYQGDTEQIEKDCWQSEETCILVFPSLDRTVHGICYLEGGELKNISLDGALPVLHGKNGEDGTLQGTLELMGVPVIGCGLLSSAICMDKDLAHQIVELGGIKTARSVIIYQGIEKYPSGEGDQAREITDMPLTGEDGQAKGIMDMSLIGEDGQAKGIMDIYKTAQTIGYPLFVKPVRSGSSFGITKVLSEEQLLLAIQEAFRHDTTVMIEEMVEGFEVGCAVLGTQEPVIGEVDEIELSDGFFDYTEKYTLKTSSIHVPARITSEKAKEIKETALKIYRLLKCTSFARVDMFLTPGGEIYFNEVNTIPGFTAHSRYPNMLKAAGITFEEVIGRLLGEI